MRKPSKDTPESIAAWDRLRASHARRDPGANFVQLQMEKRAKDLKRGTSHPTLGSRVQGFDNWWDAGASTFARYRKYFPIIETSKVIDYGCGSLRVGGHFIRFLDTGNYFGLEIAEGLLDIGRENVGPELNALKAPRLALICEASLADAEGFGADFIYSTAVAFHILPDESPSYYANLLRLTAKPGATLFFDAKIADQPLRYRARSMAWPLAYFMDMLAPLSFIRDLKLSEREAMGAKFENRILEFRRI